MVMQATQKAVSLTQALLPSLPRTHRQVQHHSVAVPGPTPAVYHMAEAVPQGEACWLYLWFTA